MKERLFTIVMIFFTTLAAVSCKQALPGPQNAIDASIRLLSVSPRAVLPAAAPSERALDSNSPTDQLPLQSQFAQ